LTLLPVSAAIRELRETDLPELLQLVRDAESFGPKAVDTERLDIKRDAIPDFGRVFVAEAEKTPVGYISVRRDGDIAVIDGVIVARKHRRRGIGRALVERAVAFARESSMREISVETGADMKEAIEFYMSCGFRISGYEQHSGGSEGQVHLRRGLQAER